MHLGATVLVASLGLAFLTACPKGSRAGGPGGVGAGGDTEVVLVWSYADPDGVDDGDGPRAVTRWLAPDGTVVDEQPLLIVAGAGAGAGAGAAGPRLWAWRDEHVSYEECDCECMEGKGEDAPPEATKACSAVIEGVGSLLVELGGAGTVDPTSHQGGDCKEALGSLVCPTFPVGGVGPYLFFARACHLYFCGAAHGDTTWAFDVIDVGTGAPTPLVTEAEKKALESGATAAALKAFAPDPEDESGDDGGDEAPTEVRLTMFRPRFVGGRVILSLQMTGEAAYAFSDGQWDSYSVSTSVDAPTLPAALAPHANVPAPAAAYLAAHPPAEGEVVGWSVLRVPAGKLDVWRARFAGR